MAMRPRKSSIMSTLGPASRFQIDLDLGGMNTLGMLVQLCPAGSPPDAFHLRYFEDQSLGDQSHPVRFR